MARAHWLGRSRRNGFSKHVAATAAALAASLLAAGGAHAQQRTFHLDRLEVPGAPDDGTVLFRPTTQQGSIFYAQLGLGYQLIPLHTRNLTEDRRTIRNSSIGVIDHQLTNYFSAGFQLFDQFTFGATFPVAWWQQGKNPNYPTDLLNSAQSTIVTTDGPAVGDIRLDARWVALRSKDRRAALGLQASLFAPTGTDSNFGGDGQVTVLPMITGEYTAGIVTLVANTGVHFRPYNSINDPGGRRGPASGLGVGDEWRWAVGAFIPIRNGKFRVGATIFGQTGAPWNDKSVIGDTFFTMRNTPIEYALEGRMRFGGLGERFWVGLSAGSRLTPGLPRVLNAYGAPDFRAVALLGMYVPLLDTDANSPDRRLAIRRSIRESGSLDRDHDGLPDDIDLCPDEPEDGKEPDPSDGCPAPPDRDNDGIPDKLDKCPDEPEDKDGINDGDGCPEDDADSDGIADTQDACPKVPGKPNKDPKLNGCPTMIALEGSTVRVLQQVHFQTGSATILPDSFPMLQEIVALLKANPGIKKMSIEGHTDNVGGAAMNLDLSKRRAASVRQWLISHGIEPERLDSEGYGLTRPIADNSTKEGRAANRRVEFKITEEEDSNKPH